MRLFGRALWILLLSAALPSARAAAAQDRQLAARLDSPTFLAVRAIMDSAREDNLPVKPLRDRALEGSAKGSDGEKIVLAVHQLALRMSVARQILGADSRPEEIKLGAGAIEAGVPQHDIARLRAACGGRSTAMPMLVLIDLVARDVPIPTATDLILQLARAGVDDAGLVFFQRNVRADIDRGADPSVAATTRMRGVILRTSAPHKPLE